MTRRGTKGQDGLVAMLVRLTPEQSDALRARAQEEDRSISSVVRRAIADELAKAPQTARPGRQR